MLNLLIKRYGIDAGILEWDANAGSFAGFAAASVRACAPYSQAHPAFPPYLGTADHDPVALAILLVCLGWDVPDDLVPALTLWLASFQPAPEGSIH